MSLNRVASIETLAVLPGHIGPRDRRASDASLRRLSFNPVPQEWESTTNQPEEHRVDTVGAFEVPQWKRLGMFNLYLRFQILYGSYWLLTD